MKIRLVVVAYLKLEKVIPKKYQDDFDEYLREVARVTGIAYGTVYPKDLANLISNLVDNEADKAYVDALRKVYGVVKKKAINELIFE